MQIKSNDSLFIMSFILSLILSGCKSNKTPTPPQSENPEIILSVMEEAGLQEIYLHVQIKNISPPAEIQLQRNGSLLNNFEMIVNDTTVIDTGLTPSTDYTYLAYVFKDNVLQDSSDVLATRTMDTTSHDFTWQTFTFGDGNGSTLKDVFIINENDIWAVGNIQVLDSTGTRWIPYNAVHWDGQEWELKKILTQTVFGTPEVVTLTSVFAFAADDVWVYSLAGAYGHWNGVSWDSEIIYETVGTITKIWGSSSSDIYFVGTNGNITHYDGSSWQLLTSGTDTDLLDVWGSPDGNAVWTCGTDINVPTVLLRNEIGLWEKEYEDMDFMFQVRSDTLSGRLVSGWNFNNHYNFILTSLGLYKIPSLIPGKIQRLSFRDELFPGFPRRVRGNAENDIFITGDFFMIVHYNGLTWRYFSEISGSGRFWSIDLKDNIVCAVGNDADFFTKGIIVKGQRN
jgi:hypothetical protein